MQGIFNTLALLSFAMSGALVGSSFYAYTKLPELKEQAIEEAKALVGELVSGAVTDAMPGQVKEMIPALPTETGPALPF
tara:strand:+ start:490 stop:726 length:237 start_codon:yes stop_codon:yes gene_type:complete